MKKNINFALCIALAAMIAPSCHNGDKEFDDFDYTAVYFAYQAPVRTLVMGDDVYDTSLDNEHKCKVYATMGGCYSNDKVVTIDVEVANYLCDDLYFDDGSPIKFLPESYYTIADDQIVLDKKLSGGVEVELTDDFFADPLALTNTYVLPLRMTDVKNADKILVGETTEENAYVLDLAKWNVEPKDYVLYCIKYINKWDANYLRRGVDKITAGTDSSEVVRHEKYVEDDEVCSTSTLSLTELLFPVTIANAAGEDVECELILTFDGDDCTVSTKTADFTATGSGEFKEDGEKKSWGDKDRDALYLEYEVSYNADEVIYNTTDTLVVRDRGVSVETFNTHYKPTI